MQYYVKSLCQYIIIPQDQVSLILSHSDHPLHSVITQRQFELHFTRLKDIIFLMEDISRKLISAKIVYLCKEIISGSIAYLDEIKFLP